MNQKPIETFTQKELDRYRGELVDFNAEKEEIAKEIDIDRKILAIDKIVTGILTGFLNMNVFDQCEAVVVSPKNRDAAFPVSRKYQLDLVVSPFIPDNEVFVCRKDKIVQLIDSRIKRGGHSA